MIKAKLQIKMQCIKLVLRAIELHLRTIVSYVRRRSQRSYLRTMS